MVRSSAVRLGVSIVGAVVGPGVFVGINVGGTDVAGGAGVAVGGIDVAAGAGVATAGTTVAAGAGAHAIKIIATNSANIVVLISDLFGDSKQIHGPSAHPCRIGLLAQLLTMRTAQ